MADATYDAVIIGGGSKTLALAMYLVKYGGMDVAVFERRHELGGGWSSEEGSAPGFIGDRHSTGISRLHLTPVTEDFPDFEEKGVKIVWRDAALSVIAREDHTCLTFYSTRVDRSQERTAREIARFSERDAETYLKLWERVKPWSAFSLAFASEWLNLAPPPGEPTDMDRVMKSWLAEPDCPIDSRWLELPMLWAARELWETPHIRYGLLRLAKTDACIELGGFASRCLVMPIYGGVIVGGTHSIAHAAQRIIIENGGKIFTKKEVDSVIIEDGKAQGIRLADGTQVKARQVVVSGLDPHQLCFRLIGKDYLDPKILRKIDNLERRFTTLCWYTWGLHEPPSYKAADFNPDVNRCGFVILGSKDDEEIFKEAAWRRLGKLPPELHPLIISYFSDTMRAPHGKYTCLHDQNVLPANALTEREWMEFKRSHAEHMIETWQQYAPNMTWDNVIGYDPVTPLDTSRGEINFGPTGNNAIIDDMPGQYGRYRPISELANHRTPIKNLYATGAAWPPSHNASVCTGYRCYKAIAYDLGLRRPWEEKGRPY